MVMQCVTTVNFAVLINGKPGRCCKPMRGLRQGDPLSPYLFIIISEVLSLLMRNAADLGFLEGIKISKDGLTLSHLLFADDTLIFLNANRSNCINVVKLLEAYCHASGKKLASKNPRCSSTQIPLRCFITNYVPF